MPQQTRSIAILDQIDSLLQELSTLGRSEEAKALVTDTRDYMGLTAPTEFEIDLSKAVKRGDYLLPGEIED